MKADAFIEVCKLGRAVGLKGFLKLHDLSDFPEQFRPKALFYLDANQTLVIAQYDKERSIVRFEGINDKDSASKLTNKILKTTKEATRALCKLKEGEFFWFDIMGCEVVEEGVKLGTVGEIERIAGQDYLSVKSDDELVKKGLQKSFLIPYVEQYIINADIQKSQILTRNAFSLLEQEN
ncbi:MAG: ribosome maturation factor RimM [Campylobacteraceae bacterium]|jgi:16S rRNA processing protein RimM|nr:ribosome maturation factor RimM [Campylobacteraceae bacterium]